ncbi:MAG: hypothetical protein ACK5P6_02580 [Pseudobdellovibrionaceae bacterium]
MTLSISGHAQLQTVPYVDVARYLGARYQISRNPLPSEARVRQLPSQPTSPSHPGSAHYTYSVQRENVQIQGRQVDFFLPKEALQRKEKIPTIVFGHGAWREKWDFSVSLFRD